MPVPAQTALVVFTDLDGTLLDHATYDWSPAGPALARLRDACVPLVLASSKTGAEIAPLRAALGFAHVPAIVENGAGVLAAGDGGVDGCRDYARLRAALDALPEDLRGRFRGFGDMGVAGIVAATGLPDDAAALAAKRVYSEPGLFDGTQAEEAAFVAALADAGVAARRGGRFLTLSFGATKADQMAALMASLAPGAATLALGDAPNDTEMLTRADHGVIVANPHGTPLPTLPGEAAGRITRTELPGPAGWNRAVLAYLDTYEAAVPGLAPQGDSLG